MVVRNNIAAMSHVHPANNTFLHKCDLLSRLRVPEGHPLLRAPVGVLGDGRRPRARQLLEAVVAEALLAARARRHVEREGRAVRRTALIRNMALYLMICQFGNASVIVMWIYGCVAAWILHAFWLRMVGCGMQTNATKNPIY